MTIAAGTRLGSYEIVSALGAGGMGEVYRARDTKLDRDVAVKVLPEQLSANARTRSPGSSARPRRSRRSRIRTSSRSSISGRQDGVAYAVMELLEGETLREKLDAGPVSQRQASTGRCRSRRASPRRTARASSTGT